MLCKDKPLPGKIGITKGIAVLPFENLSPDPDNAYLAEGYTPRSWPGWLQSMI
jgi:TolB-like protein